MSTNQSPTTPDRPSIPEWRLYEQRVDQRTMQPVGFKTPQGKFYRFKAGEQLVWNKVDGSQERDGFIRGSDGKEVDLQTWIAGYEN
ncbi:hypothetical protein HY213_01800 [Candidatus Peregrinibacteria bacterium]|nr:hypothetical protein [Candidatus Peregrinibacteria bacterium]